MIEIKNFCKSYTKDKNVVDNLSLKVESGDIFGFVGHNGAGKTTTIKSIVGINDFDSGEILIDGISIKENPIECKKIMAYVPDSPDLYEHLTGIEYLNFIADVFEVSTKDRNIRIPKYAKTFEIDKNLGDPISSYSHGMKQKITIISALIHNPKIMVLDEPFVGLDPVSTYTLKEIINSMCSEGCSIFFSTHILEVAEKLCNKVAIIKKGKLVACGDMKKVIKDKSLEDIFLEIDNNE